MEQRRDWCALQGIGAVRSTVTEHDETTVFTRFFISSLKDVHEFANAVRAIPHKDRLTALHVICLHIFRQIVQKFLDIRQYACVISVQSDEKSDCASDAQSLCGVALENTGR